MLSSKDGNADAGIKLITTTTIAQQAANVSQNTLVKLCSKPKALWVRSFNSLSNMRLVI